MPRHLFPIFILLFTVAFAGACQKTEEPSKAISPLATTGEGTPAANGTGDDEPPPAPPIREDFEGEPKLSLFPRVSDFRPEETDKAGQSYWLTFIDHVVRTSGPVRGKNGNGFAIRGIKGVASVGFFSPLAVNPDSVYRVTFRAWAKLPEGAAGGAGILEFDEFLWVPGQYPKSLSEKHFQRAQPGVQLTGTHEGSVQNFSFHTGPETHMIHLVFFREGTPGREPFVIDDIEIKAE